MCPTGGHVSTELNLAGVVNELVVKCNRFCDGEGVSGDVNVFSGGEREALERGNGQGKDTQKQNPAATENARELHAAWSNFM